MNIAVLGNYECFIYFPLIEMINSHLRRYQVGKNNDNPEISRWFAHVQLFHAQYKRAFFLMCFKTGTVSVLRAWRSRGWGWKLT